MTAVRFGVLGLGSIAQVVHLPILTQQHDVEITAVCDADYDKARTIGGRIGTRVLRSDEEVYGADDVDAIVICTPNYLHAPQAIAALEAGKHVLVEKPLALSPEDARRVVAAARASDRVLMVAMNNRYRPDTLALKPFAEGGELGHVFLTRGAWLNKKMRLARPTWRHRLATAGGGALMDLGVQTLDLCLWTLGFPEAASVFCHLHTPPGAEVEDTAALLLRMADGSCISLTISWTLVAERDRHYMRLLGTRGSAMIQPLAIYKEGDNGLLDVTPALPTTGRENAYTASYRAELVHFVAAIRGDATVEPPAEQVGLMAIVEAAYRSAAERREVEVAGAG